MECHRDKRLEHVKINISPPYGTYTYFFVIKNEELKENNSFYSSTTFYFSVAPINKCIMSNFEYLVPKFSDMNFQS